MKKGLLSLVLSPVMMSEASARSDSLLKLWYNHPANSGSRLCRQGMVDWRAWSMEILARRQFNSMRLQCG